MSDADDADPGPVPDSGAETDLACLEGGDPVERFEAGFARLAGTRFALGLASGTAALHTALLAADIGPGDEVLVSPYGWGQTVAAVLLTGATPVFADIEPTTGNLDPGAAAAAVGARTRAVLVTHLFGIPADLGRLGALCRDRGLRLIADGAQALGARHAGRPIAAWADITCFSLGRGKPLSIGEGGMAVTSDTDLYERMLLVSQHPLRALGTLEDPLLRASVTGFGLSYRLSRPACETGLARLAGVGAWIARWRALARALVRRIGSVEGLVLTTEAAGDTRVHHALVLRALGDGLHDPRPGLIERLASLDLDAVPGPVRTPLHLRFPFARERTGRWFPKAMWPAGDHPSWRPGSCPRAERRCACEELQLDLDGLEKLDADLSDRPSSRC